MKDRSNTSGVSTSRIMFENICIISDVNGTWSTNQALYRLREGKPSIEAHTKTLLGRYLGYTREIRTQLSNVPQCRAQDSPDCLQGSKLNGSAEGVRYVCRLADLSTIEKRRVIAFQHNSILWMDRHGQMRSWHSIYLVHSYGAKSWVEWILFSLSLERSGRFRHSLSSAHGDYMRVRDCY